MYIDICPVNELFKHIMITVIDFSLAIFSWVGDASFLELPERPVVGLREAVIFARITSDLHIVNVFLLAKPLAHHICFI